MLQSRPIIAISIGWLLGNIIISSFSMTISALILLSIILFLFILLLFGKSTRMLTIIVIACLLAGAGQRYYVDIHNKTQLSLLQMDQLDETFSIRAIGVVTSTVEIDGDRAAFDLLASEVYLTGDINPQYLSEKFKVYLTIQHEEELLLAAEWKRGMSVEIQGEMNTPASKSNEGGFDYLDYLKYNHIHWLLKAKGVNSLQEVSAISGSSLFRLLAVVDELRIRLASPLDKLFSKEQSGYLKGLILGIRQELDPEQFRQFSTIGLTHILAISGLHVAVFMYIVTAILRLLRFSKEKIIYALLFFIPFYVALTGASPSVLRAGLMAMLGLVAAKMNVLKDGLHLIAVVALALVVIDPYMIHNISFQLSFIVTIGIIVGVPAIRRSFLAWKKGKWLADTMSVTIVAQVVSFPLTIYYFNQFHILSLIANLILVPFISGIVLPLASFVLFLGHIHSKLAGPFVYIVEWSNDASFAIVSILSKVESLHFIWATPPVWWILLWYGFLFALFYLLKSQYESSSSADNVTLEMNMDTAPLAGIDELSVLYPKKKSSYWRTHRKLFSLLCLIILSLIFAYEPMRFNHSTYVSFIDVGQGDASYIRTSSGKHILIDGGGTISFRKSEDLWKDRQDPFEVGKDVLLPLLMKRGVHQIDILIISHLDSDHIGGLKEVIKGIPIKEIWWNGSYKDNEDVEALFTLVIEKNITLRTPIIGEKIIIDNTTTAEILWPLKEKPSRISNLSDQNDQSLVVLISIFDFKFLYSGDIGEKAEDEIVEQLYQEHNNLSNISVMKVAHHGSRYSSSYSWLSYFQPQVSVISVGQYNFYGHPHPLTLERLENYNSLILRTDKLGEVKLRVVNDDIYTVLWK